MTSNKAVFQASWLFVLVLASFLFFFRLGDRSFRNPDEGRYVEIPRQMLTTGDWTVPRLYGVDYLRKPPFYYWLVAGSLQIFGMNEWAARLVGALAGILGVMGIYYFCRKVLDAQTAIYASAILATNVWYIQVGRFLLIDMLFSFLIAAAALTWHLARRASVQRAGLYLLFYGLAALSFLTKGVAGPLILGICVLAHAFVYGEAKKIFSGKYLFFGIILFLIIAAPWFWLMSRYEPGFLKFFFIHEHFSRFTSAQFEHQEPWYFYLMFITGIFFPWSLILCIPSNSKNNSPVIDISQRVSIQNKRNTYLYVGVITASIVLFYSASRTKLATYIVPCLPMLSILAGAKYAELVENKDDYKHRKFVLIFSALLITLSLCVLLAPGELFYSYFQGKKQLAGECIRFSAFFTLAAAAALIAFSRTLKKIFLGILFSLALVSVCGTLLMEKANALYTTKEFAAVLKPMLKENDTVCIYGHPGAFYDFAFYLQANVSPVGRDGEFEHMSEKDIARNKVVSFEDFDEWVKQGKMLYCLIRRSDFEGKADVLKGRVRVIHEDQRKVLFKTNQ